jgi:hypothetical protein
MGGLKGVSHLDRYLRFDSVSADMFPLDVAARHVETDFPPILAVFLKKDVWTANRSIRGPTITMAKRRIGVSFYAGLLGSVTRRKQLVTATACLKSEPDHLDKLPRFDSIPADFLPLDTVMPYVESETPPRARAFFFRDAREAPAGISVSASVPAQRRVFYFLPPICLTGSGAMKAKITGRGHPPERPSCIDDFPRFDSIPADFVPLDKPLPHREGIFVWR